MMRTLILLAILSVTFIFAQGPVISDNFVAVVDFLVDGRIQERAQVWEDFNAQESRFDFERREDHVLIHQYNFYKLLKSYIVDERTRNCTVTPLTTTLKPAFGWALNATRSTRPCHSEINVGRLGVLWSSVTATETLYLCVDATEPTRPLWVERVTAREHDYYEFRAFLAGVPPAQVFDLPAFCSK
eukprot:TRINITY_DN638_c0_g1_i2.p1 TRINITY_DN638_c0_g1~~TRINITY_DN638_c0_g1_i2.p1  ORF type:complete len:186 (-),score=37.80 TRINITY_DN638_c0_g1_i2:80-637(-)